MLRDSQLPYLDLCTPAADDPRLPVWASGLIVFGLSGACYAVLFQIARMLWS